MQLVLDTADFLRMSLLGREERDYAEVADIRNKIQAEIPGVVIDLSRPALNSALARHPEAFDLAESNVRLKKSDGFETFSYLALISRYSALASEAVFDKIMELLGETKSATAIDDAETE